VKNKFHRRKEKCGGKKEKEKKKQLQPTAPKGE
jgi:hypothetical protein